MFRVVSGNISWKSKKQRTVDMFTMDAEYTASSDATREAIFLRQLLCDFGLAFALSDTNDIMGVFLWPKTFVYHDKAKDIDVAPLLPREARGQIDRPLACRLQIERRRHPMRRNLYTAHTRNLRLNRTHIAPSGGVRVVRRHSGGTSYAHTRPDS
jgi:hypothetical protein